MLDKLFFIVVGVVGVYVFSKVREFIVKRTSTAVSSRFEVDKFVGGFFGVFNPVLWAKDIVSLFNVRKLLIYGVILGVVAGFFYWQGLQGKPVKMDIEYGKEAYIKLDGSYLHIDKDGLVYLEDEEGNKLKRISVRDIPSLKKKLAPIGVEFKPIAIMGYGVGEISSGLEGGAGVRFFRYWSWRLESFLTNKGIYLGTSYKLKAPMQNSAVGIGAGKGWRGDNRVIVYFSLEF